jgi:hypothetical protein
MIHLVLVLINFVLLNCGRYYLLVLVQVYLHESIFLSATCIGACFILQLHTGTSMIYLAIASWCGQNVKPSGVTDNFSASGSASVHGEQMLQ